MTEPVTTTLGIGTLLSVLRQLGIEVLGGDAP